MNLISWLFPKAPIKYEIEVACEWQDKKGYLGGMEYRYIDTETTKVLAEIKEFSTNLGLFHVFKNGAGYGEYLSLGEAKKKAESLA